MGSKRRDIDACDSMPSVNRRTRRHGSFIGSVVPVVLAVASIGCGAAQEHPSEPNAAELLIVSTTAPDSIDESAKLRHVLMRDGVPIWDTLFAATVEPRRFLNRRLGVQIDDEASLVVLARNPLAGIDNTTVINAEIKRGRLVGRKALPRSTSVDGANKQVSLRRQMLAQRVNLGKKCEKNPSNRAGYRAARALFMRRLHAHREKRCERTLSGLWTARGEPAGWQPRRFW